MDLNNFTSLAPSVIDDLYEEPEKLDVYSFEDYMNLPLNDLYKEKNGEYKPECSKFSLEKPEPEQESEPEPEPEPIQYKNSERSIFSKENEEPTLYKNSNEFLYSEPEQEANIPSEK
jgi:hypothetical protein